MQANLADNVVFLRIMRRRSHYILFLITVLFSGFCLYLIPRINVNSDMTKYLPDDSPMKEGLEIISGEFGEMPTSAADVRVMVKGLNPAERDALEKRLLATENVDGVSVTVSKDSCYSLYAVAVPKSIDQKSFGKEIRKSIPQETIVETSQDGATPPVSVIIIAAVLILLILFLMAQSWIEPVIILITTLIAVLLNMGTNAFLPSVSITTNFIGSILQAVLSLDYCIVLMNRYRQEQGDNMERDMAVKAANAAIRRSYPSILSSALTTVVGLIVLCFMRLKIGTDMGVVLAKGVICSLICTFTVLPSLMMLFRRSIKHTSKKSFVIPTNRIGRWSTRMKYPLAVFAILLFGLSFYFSQQTTIYFSANGESEIDKVFPRVNPAIVLYETSEESKINTLVDSISQMPDVQMVISYPSLLQKPYTSGEILERMSGLLAQSGVVIPAEFKQMLSPEMATLIYYMQSGKDAELKLGFPELAKFIESHCLNNELFADAITPEMRQQMELLKAMSSTPEPPAPKKTPAPKEVRIEKVPAAPASVDTSRSVSIAVTNAPVAQTAVVSETPVATAQDSLIAISHFVSQLYINQPDANTQYLMALVDKNRINSPLAIPEMAAFIGSSVTQTRMVYSFDKEKRKQLTPLEYTHLLSDDLFNRKALAGMVTAEQKKELRRILLVMDYANNDALLSSQQLVDVFAPFLPDLTPEYVWDIAGKRHVAAPLTVSAVIDVVQDSVRVPALVAPPTPKVVVKPVVHRPTEAEKQAEFFYELMYGGHKYTAEEMASNFRKLGQTIASSDVSLLYTYYGSVYDADTTQMLTIEQLVNYLGNSLANDERLAPRLDSTSRAMLSSIPAMLADGMGQLRGEKHSIMAILTDLPDESEQTYQFVETVNSMADQSLDGNYYMMGESVMYDEMKNGFGAEMTRITILTILAIFLIIAFSFRSIVVPTILVMTVMTAVYVNVVVAGLTSGAMLYLAYLIVQSILMGATIDYGILFTNYYKENRKTQSSADSILAAYRGSIRTIMTSGLIMVAAPGVMALYVDDVTISSIVGCIAIGALVAIILILTVLPGMLVAFDRWVVKGENAPKK